MNDTKELRRLAQAATAGEWYVERGNHIYGRNEVTDKEEVWNPVIACTDDDEINVNFEANAAFIAAANPAAISELLDRLEAAEKERDNANAAAVGVAREAERLQCENDALRAALRHEADCVESAKAEIDALRAKIETAENDAAHQKALAASALRVAEGWERKCGELRAKVAEMGQQEPVGVLHVGSYYGEELQDWEFEANQCACDKLNEAYVRNPMSLPLYALPGAQTQPAPSVPTALLVAVANLVAQMEIVSRVGFVDTPNDKDSCAAFCVAEGTWLELMSAVESLAASLAAAPEAKP